MNLEVKDQREVDDHVVIVVGENAALFEKVSEYPIERAKANHSSCVADEICELGIDLLLEEEG